MNTRLPARIVLPLALILMALLACALPGASGVDPSARATGAAMTVQAILTQTGPTQAPTITPVIVVTNTPVPTAPAAEPVPSVTSAPTSAVSCTNDSKFVQDVSVPDNTHFAANTPFVKTWRIRNTGTCTWDGAYQFRFIEGESMGAPSGVEIGGTVAPNGTVDVSVSFTSPSTAGTHRSRWRVFAPDGTPFGQKPYVQIVVP